MFTFLRRLLGILILLASLGLLAWGLWPAPVTKAVQALLPTQMQLPPSGGPGTTGIQSVPPGVPETRQLNLDYPSTLREGDGDVIRLTLERDAQGGLVPTTEFDGHTTTGDVVQIPNVYNTHRVELVGRVDLPGVEISPSEPVALPVNAGQKVSIVWTVKSAAVGTYRGAVWSALRFTPLAGGASSEQNLASQVVSIDVVNFFGIGGMPARLMGLVGSAVGGTMGMDKLLVKLLRGLLFRQRKPKRRK